MVRTVNALFVRRPGIFAVIHLDHFIRILLREQSFQLLFLLPLFDEHVITSLRLCRYITTLDVFSASFLVHWVPTAIFVLIF
jgi:hypothetical protein